MNKPTGYDEAKEFTEFKRLPKGGYICKIVKLEEAVSKQGNDMIVAYLDIADGEYKGYYMSSYQSDTRSTKKWGCIYRQVVLDTTTRQTSPGFKGFMTSVEESNPGFVTAKVWGDNFTKFFKDKYIGCIFADEHYTNAQGEPRTIAKPNRVCSIQKIKSGDFVVPEDKQSDSIAAAPLAADPFAGFTEMATVSDDDLPF